MTPAARALWALLESTPPAGSDVDDIRSAIRQLIAIRSMSAHGARLLGCTSAELRDLERAIESGP